MSMLDADKSAGQLLVGCVVIVDLICKQVLDNDFLEAGRQAKE